MTEFRSVLAPACIIPDLDAKDKEAVFRALIGRFEAEKYTTDPAELFSALMEREAMASTGLGWSCAIPHAHSASMKETRLAFARLKHPVDFGAPDNVPASLVFLMAGPKSAAGAHLQLLSKLARLLHDEAFRSALAAEPDPAALAGLFYAKDE